MYFLKEAVLPSETTKQFFKNRREHFSWDMIEHLSQLTILRYVFDTKKCTQIILLLRNLHLLLL